MYTNLTAKSLGCVPFANRGSGSSATVLGRWISPNMSRKLLLAGPFLGVWGFIFAWMAVRLLHAAPPHWRATTGLRAVGFCKLLMDDNIFQINYIGSHLLYCRYF